MAAGSTTNRITSKDTRIEVTPTGASASPNVARLYIRSLDGATPAGTFRLWVNGKITAAITYSATVGTLATSIASALNHANVLGAAAVTCVDSVTDAGFPEITNAVNGYFRYKVVIRDDDGDITLTGATADLVVVTQGTATFVASADMGSFNVEESVDMVDMTAIGEQDYIGVPVKKSGAFDIMLFRRNDGAEDAYIYEPGSQLSFVVYETGKVSGQRYFSFSGWTTSFSKDYPDKEKVELSISGELSGGMIVPFDTVYRP